MSKYQVDKLRELAARHGVVVLESPSQVPDELMATCLEQLGRHYDMPNDPVTTQGYHWHKVYDDVQWCCVLLHQRGVFHRC